MGRKIVLLSDGTGNSSAKIWRTNVWRTFERLDLSGDSQVAFYDDGVGTSRFKLFALLTGAVGYGLKWNVLDLYKFVCRNYRSPDDKIFGFGFSRGAFTMRIVAGLIADQGLVYDTDEAALHQKALAAYRAYRAKRFHTRWPFHPEKYLRMLRDALVRTRGFRYEPEKNRQNVEIEFLGLWDTVAAYGMPIEVMSRGVNDWLWPLGLPDPNIHASVQRACHAVAIDDERRSFHPVLMNETDAPPLAPDQNGDLVLANERISQVWFTGAHSNVGGGYPDDSLAHIPLCWILSEACARGLELKKAPDANPQTLEYALTARDKDGRLYDPRGGLGAYYRYGPRNIVGLLEKQGRGTRVRIHESVFRRIKNRAHAYAPVGLPGAYEVVTWEGKVLPQSAAVAEDPGQGAARAIAQRDVGNRIWARSTAYVLTVLLTATLLLYPLFNVTRDGDQHGKYYSWFSQMIEGLGGILPDVAEPWIKGYAHDPMPLAFLVPLLLASLWLSSRLNSQIAQKMDRLWQTSLANGLAKIPYSPSPITRLREAFDWFAGQRWIARTVAPVLSALLVLGIVLAIVNRVAFKLQDYAGWTCPPTLEKPQQLSVGHVIVEPGPDGNRTLEYEKVFKTPLAPGEKPPPITELTNLPSFDTTKFCQGLGVELARGRTYLIQIENPMGFEDDGFDASKGFYASDEKLPFARQLVHTLGTPLKRAWRQKWFTITARIGSVGAEEEYLLPEPNEDTAHLIYAEHIKPKTTGELFLYVNDAVFAWPGPYGTFYRNNEGKTRVLVRQVK